MNYLLYGNNELDLDERLAQLRLELDPTTLGTTEVVVQESSLDAIRAAAHALPFFGAQRLVILRDPIATKRSASGDGDGATDSESTGRIPWPELHTLIGASPETTAFIVRHVGSLSPNHFMVKALKQRGWTIEAFPALFGDELLSWIGRRVQQQEMKIEPAAVRRVAELLYPTSWQGGRWINETPDTRLLAAEIDKLCAAATDGIISTELVNTMTADRDGFTAFRLNDHLFSGRTEQALVELDNVLAAGEPAERVLSQIAAEAISLSAVKQSGKVGDNAGFATATGISAGRMNGLQRRAGAITPRADAAIAESLRGLDEGVKTGRTSDVASAIVPLAARISETIKRG